MNNKVLFCGDICPTEKSVEYFTSGDVNTLFNDVLPLMLNASNVIVNFEGAITDTNYPIRKMGPNLKGPHQTADTLKKANITACGLANNHILDFGETGLYDTFNNLDRVGIDRFGAADNETNARQPYFFFVNDKKIGVLPLAEHEYTYAIEDKPGAAPFDPYDTIPFIGDVKEKCDYLVIMYHGGKEQCEYPSPRLRKVCHSFVKMGADLVLCQHSHIIGTYEKINGAMVLYGQGNFNFVDLLDLKGWKTGLVLSVEFGSKMKFEFIPIIETEHGIRLMNDEEKEKCLFDLEKRSISLIDGAWIDGWNEFVEEKRESYTKAIEDVGHAEDKDYAKEFFAAYLQCEAHYDVLRSLYPNWHEVGIDNSEKR